MVIFPVVLLLFVSFLWSDGRSIPDISGDEHNRVLNMDGVLSKQGWDAAQNLLVEIENEIKHDCGGETKGYQVAAAVISRLFDWEVAREKSGSAADKMEVFTRAVHDTWGVGNLPCNDGAVLAFSIIDRQMYVSRGAGMESILEDKFIDVVFDRMRPYLVDEDYDGAIISGVLDLKTLIKQDKNSPEYKELMGHLRGNVIVQIVIIVCVVLFVLLMIFCCIFVCYKQARVSREWREMRHRLQQLDRLIRENFPGGKISALSYPAVVVSPGGGGKVPAMLQSSYPAPSAPDSDDALQSTSSVYTPLTDQLSCCPICFEDYSYKVVTDTRRCGHTFCRSCITAWLKKKPTCPLCREDIRGDEKKPVAAGATAPHDAMGVAPAPSAPEMEDPTAASPSVLSSTGPSSRQPHDDGSTTDYAGIRYKEMTQRERIRRYEGEMYFLLERLIVRYPYASRRWNFTPNMMYYGTPLIYNLPSNLSVVETARRSHGGSTRRGGSSFVSSGGSFGGGFSSGGRGGSW